ncbi:MAG: DUF2848 domain-containing protein [Burkholderiales bacterium]
MLRFTLHDAAGSREAAFGPAEMVIAGWAARDRAAIDHHIEELAAIGVPRPSTVPLFYRVAASTLTQSDTIECVGAGSSGEVEPVLFIHAGRPWLTVGSDHTDREAETYSVALSKQMCAKPVAREAWALDELAPRLDTLTLRSWIEEDGREIASQDGTLAALLPATELLSRYLAGRAAPDGLVMSCGTLGAIGGVRPSTAFRMALGDPATGRTIGHAYRTRVLPKVA